MRGDNFRIRPAAQAKGQFLKRTLLIIVGAVLIAAALMVLWPGLRPSSARKTKVPEATFSRSVNPSKTKLSKTFLGQSANGAQPEPTVVHVPGPQDDREVQRLREEVAQLRKENEMRSEALKRVPTPTGTPATAKTTAPDPDAQRRAEAKREAEREATKLRVWKPPDDKEAPSRIPELQSPATPYSLAPGWMIPCETEFATSNEISGAFKVRVTEPVYDSATGQHVVIPQWSTLVMKPAGQTIFGDARQGVTVQTLTFPNSEYITLDGAHGTDQSGLGGFSDQVDRRYKQLFASVILTGVLNAGTGIVSSGAAGGGPVERIVGGVGSETARQGSNQVRQTIRTEPRIHIRPGYLCNVFLESELSLPRAWD